MTSYSDFSPSFDEAAMARKSYLDWERANAEEMAEYVYRRRSVDLSFLVGEAVKNELTESERKVVKKVYYDRKSLTETAKELGVNKSTADRTLKRAVGKLRKCLCYVIKYQYNLREVPFLPLAVREALALDALRSYSPSGFGERLYKLRRSENIGLEEFSRAVSVSEKRLRRLESGSEAPNVAELLAFSGFFKTTVDYLLTGK
jgi:hypothetical protein